MKTKHITHDLSVSSQLSLDDVAIVAAMGFKSIICNRPDGEASDQILFEDIRKVAVRLDIKGAYLPMKDIHPSEKEMAEVADLLMTLPRPIIAYCKTGDRSEALLSSFFEKET